MVKIFQKRGSLKKGQAALEYLMTYGWAILVVLVGIGALAYFGVLNPSQILPDKCLFQPGFRCDGFAITTDHPDVSVDNHTTITLVGENTLGKSIRITNLSVEECFIPGPNNSLPINVKQEEDFSLSFILSSESHTDAGTSGTGSGCEPDSLGIVGDRIAADLVIYYYETKIPSITKKLEGEVSGKIELQ